MSDISHKRDISPLRETKVVDEQGDTKKSMKELLFDDDKKKFGSKRIRTNSTTNMQVVPDGIEAKDIVEFKVESTIAKSVDKNDLNKEDVEDSSHSTERFQCKTEGNMTEIKIECHNINAADKTASSAQSPFLDPNIFVSCFSNSPHRSASPLDPNSRSKAPAGLPFDDLAKQSGSSLEPHLFPVATADTAPHSTSISDPNIRSADFMDTYPLSVSSSGRNSRFADSTGSPLSVSPFIPNPPSAGTTDTAPLSACFYDDYNTRSADFTDTAILSAFTNDDNTRSGDFTDTVLLSSSSYDPNARSLGSTETASLSTSRSDFSFVFASPPVPIPCSHPNHCSADSSDQYTSPPDFRTLFDDSHDSAPLSLSPSDLVLGSPSNNKTFSILPDFSLCTPSPPDYVPLYSSTSPSSPCSFSAPLWTPDNGPPQVQKSEEPQSITIASPECLMAAQHQREPSQSIVVTPGDGIQPTIHSENNSETHPHLAPNKPQSLDTSGRARYASGICLSEHHQSPLVQTVPCTNLHSRSILASPYQLRQRQPNKWQTQRLIMGLIQAQRRFNGARLRGFHSEEISSQLTRQQSQQFQAQQLHDQQLQAQQFHAQQFHAHQYQMQQFHAQQFRFQEFQTQPYLLQQFQAARFQSPRFQPPRFQPPRLITPPFHAQQFQAQQFQAQQFQAQQFEAQQFQAQQFQAQQFQAQLLQAQQQHSQQHAHQQLQIQQQQQYQQQQQQQQQQLIQQPHFQQHYDFQHQAQQLTGSPLQVHPYYGQQWRTQQSQARPYHAQQHSAQQLENQQIQGLVLQPQGSQAHSIYQSESPSVDQHPRLSLLPGVIQMPIGHDYRNSIHHQQPGIHFREELLEAPLVRNQPGNAGMEMVYHNQNRLPLFEDEQCAEYPGNYPGDHVQGKGNH